MKFDILSINDKSTTIKLEASKISSIKNSEIKKYGIRRFENGKVFQSSHIGEANESQLINANREWGGPGMPHSYGFAPEKTEQRIGPVVNDDLLLNFEEQVQKLISRFPNFVFSGKCTISHTKINLSSNYGIDVMSQGGVCSWYLYYQQKGSGNMIDGMISGTSANPNFNQDLSEHAEFLEVQNNEVIMNEGRIPVLLVDPGGVLKKFRESILINRYKDGAALFSDKLGEQLFSTKVNIQDISYEPKIGVIDFFDGEGTVRSKDEFTLIDQGKFVGLISDLRFAHKYNLTSTGNGIRSFNTGVNLMPRTMAFSKGTQSWQEIVKSLDKCLVAIISAGGDSNDLGEYSAPVQVGYVYEKGQLKGRSPQVTVKTNLLDYLGKDLIAVANNSFAPNSISSSVVSEMDIFIN